MVLLDIGGGHFLDVKRKSVGFSLSLYAARKWNLHDRVSRFAFGDGVDHPLEANLWQFQ